MGRARGRVRRRRGPRSARAPALYHADTGRPDAPARPHRCPRRSRASSAPAPPTRAWIAGMHAPRLPRRRRDRARRRRASSPSPRRVPQRFDRAVRPAVRRHARRRRRRRLPAEANPARARRIAPASRDALPPRPLARPAATTSAPASASPMTARARLVPQPARADGDRRRPARPHQAAGRPAHRCGRAPSREAARACGNGVIELTSPRQPANPRAQRRNRRRCLRAPPAGRPSRPRPGGRAPPQRDRNAARRRRPGGQPGSAAT